MAEPQSPKGETILIVDDETAILSLAEMTLEEDGYQVLTASSAERAMEIAATRSEPIDLFLLDVVMPETGGPELAVRLAEKHPQTPVIFASGYGDGAGVALRQRDQSAIYLKKPFSPDELSSLVKDVLARAG